MLSITEPTPQDAAELALSLRDGDKAELEALNYTDHEAAILESVKVSARCWAVRYGGKILFIAGVAPVAPGSPVGAVWLLGSVLMGRHKKLLTRLVKGYLPKMHEVCPVLLNYVYAKNIVSVRWLKGMGFNVNAPTPYGPKGALFHYFEKELNV